MNTDNYIKIIGLIVTIFAFIGTIFNLEKNKIDKLKEEYFKNLLIVYINEYKKHKKLNAVKFINKRYTMNNYFIPSYIFYLADENKKELLHKVLIVDYRNNFPRKRNSISNVISSIDGILRIVSIYISDFVRALYIIALPLSFIFLILTIIFNIYGVNRSVTIAGIQISDIQFSILTIITIIIILLILKYMQKKIINKVYDDYTMKKGEIEKVLEKKEKEYSASNDYYIV